MKLNEAKFRSPQWLRNFVDFEVNTGDDISGEPSKRKTAKIEKEKQAKLKAEAADEGVRITKKVGLGFLTVNILLNEVSQYDDRFRYFDNVFYRQIGDAIHQCVHYYKFRLVYIQMDGSTHQNVFTAGKKFRTLEEWEALDKEKLYDGHKLKLTRISINFEL